jgi:hypothetical protein
VTRLRIISVILHGSNFMGPCEGSSDTHGNILMHTVNSCCFHRKRSHYNLISVLSSSAAIFMDSLCQTLCFIVFNTP